MEILHEHHTIIRREIARHAGFEVKTEGDAFMIAFGSTRTGLHFGIAAQRALAERNTTADTILRVRMGFTSARWRGRARTNAPISMAATWRWRRAPPRRRRLVRCWSPICCGNWSSRQASSPSRPARWQR